MSEELTKFNWAVDDIRLADILSIKHSLEDNTGNLCKSIDTYYQIMSRDPAYKFIRYNQLLNSAEVNIGGKVRRWTDADEAASRRHIQKYYHLYSKDFHTDALRILFREREYNPVADLIQSFSWDGTERVEHFLTRWAKVEDSAYTREVSRLIFADGIARVFEPGSKCDDVPIFIGNQGSGKSSLIRFLAINDDYFGEVRTMDGDKATEQLLGKFVLEIPEMAAFTKLKEVEAIKAFITRQRDNYRTPYDRHPADLPRRCIFVGTTNNPNPLTDLSGNRRYYPVKVNSNGYEVFRAEAEIRDYINQCWAEAYHKYKLGAMPHYANPDLVEEYKAHQTDALQDDWRVPALEAWLDDKPVGYFTYCKQIFREVFAKDKLGADPEPRDSKDIGIMMAAHTNWKRCAGRTSYGTQRGWRKEAEKLTEIVDDNALPF